MKRMMMSTIQDRVVTLENAVNNRVNRRVTNQLTTLERGVNRKVAEIFEEEVVRSGGLSWKAPFMVLVVIVASIGIGLYSWYQRLRKTHLL